MKLVTFLTLNGPRLGALARAGKILDLAAAATLTGRPTRGLTSMLELIETADPALEEVQRLLSQCPEEALHDRDAVRLLAPLPAPPRLRDCSLFLEHMENALERWARNLAAQEPDPEAAYDKLVASGKFRLAPVFREQVIFYNADHLSVCGPDQDILWPADSTYADFELEWACVLRGTQVACNPTEARQAIFGYTIYNDWSARDLQLRFMQANLGPSGGKDFALSNTLGPCVVTADELVDPYRLKMTARVNGEIWTEGSTQSMHHHFEDAIAQFSRYEPLRPGEVLGSGTVRNGCGYEQGRQLGDGDLVELEVEGIGTLRNRVRFQQS